MLRNRTAPKKGFEKANSLLERIPFLLQRTTQALVGNWERGTRSSPLRIRVMRNW